MTSVQGIILLFTKYPEAGTSKTRLIPSLGKEGAAHLQRRLAESMSQKVSHYCTKYQTDSEIHYSGGSNSLMKKWLGPELHYLEQCSGDLGQRMASAISMHLEKYKKIVLIGSDCPGIDEKIFESAFKGLEGNDIVMGPAHDGGYYLVGVQGNLPESTVTQIFQDIEWGRADVLQHTLSIISQLQLSCDLLEKLHDIDTPEDLRYLNHHSHAE